MPVEFSVHEERLRALGRALRAEEDGKTLRKELVKNLRDALKPAADEAKAAIKSMPSSGARHGGMSLRNEVAKKVAIEVRLGGRSVGAKVKAKKTPGVRGFANAPKRLNRAKGWRHPFFGDKERWYSQLGKVDWFDGPMRAGKPRYRQAVIDAMEATARKIKGKIG
jgi:hypothetical protein